MASKPSGLQIPLSSSAVDVSVIDTTTFFNNNPCAIFLEPIYSGWETSHIPVYSFLIHHKSSDQRILFDLGLRKNWQTHLPPNLLKQIATIGIDIKVEKDVSEILKDNGLPLANINHIILSHHHWDHVGDPSKFPASTSLIVGPGYKNKYLPGWPADPECTATTTDTYTGREVIELDVTSNDKKVRKIGPYSAYDWFGDESFYILSTPGHTTGHLCCLARTTSYGDASTFMFIGGDIAHHCAIFRPTPYCPLPETISPAPYEGPHSQSSCSGDLFASVHRLRAEPDGKKKSRETPFCVIPDGWVDEDYKLAQKTLDQMQPFDGDENVFTIFAHDETVMDIIDFYPKKANSWKAEGWANRSHWRFLGPLKIASQT